MLTENPLLAMIAPAEPKLYDVDISAYLTPGNTLVLQWKEPDVAWLYSRQQTAIELNRDYPAWPLDLCYEVATMAACHFAPNLGMPSGQFYAKIANGKNPRLWYLLAIELKDAFPHLRVDTDIKNFLLPSSAPVDATETDTP